MWSLNTEYMVWLMALPVWLLRVCPSPISTTFQPWWSSPTSSDKTQLSITSQPSLFLWSGKASHPHLFFWFVSVSFKVTAWDSLTLITLAMTGLHTHSYYFTCFRSAIPTWKSSFTYIVTVTYTATTHQNERSNNMRAGSSSVFFTAKSPAWKIVPDI